MDSAKIDEFAKLMDGASLRARVDAVGYVRALAETSATLGLAPEAAIQVMQAVLGPPKPLPDWLKADLCINPDGGASVSLDWSAHPDRGDAQDS